MIRVSTDDKMVVMLNGAKIRELREGREWTQMEFARRVGCPHSTISLYERTGTTPEPPIRSPLLFMVERIAETLEVEVGDILMPNPPGWDPVMGRRGKGRSSEREGAAA